MAKYQALIVEDTSVTPWASETTMKGDGHHVGQPVPDAGNTGSMGLRCRRATRDYDPGEVTVDVHRGGTAGLGAAPFPTTVTWQKDGGRVHGWDSPGTIHWHERMIETPGGGTEWRHPHIATLADGRLIGVVERYLAGDESYLVPRRWSPPSAGSGSGSGGGWVGFGAILTTDSAPNSSALNGRQPSRQPCLVPLPDGSCLLYAWDWEEVVGYLQLHAWRLPPGGTAFQVFQKRCLQLPLIVGSSSNQYEPYRIRGAYLDGQVLLVATAREAANSSRFLQFASQDGGASFDRIDLTAGTTGKHDVVATEDGFIVAALDARNVAPTVWRLGSAFTSLDDAEVISTDATLDAGQWYDPLSALIQDTGDLCLCLQDTGVLWMYGREADGNEDTVIAVSRDAGRTWSLDDGWFYADEADCYLQDTAVAWHRGSAVLVGSPTSPSGNSDGNVLAFRLGGSTTLETFRLPGQSAPHNIDPNGFVGWASFEEPDQLTTNPWTLSPSPLTTDISGAVLEISNGTGASGVHYYEWTRSSSWSGTVRGHGVCRPDDPQGSQPDHAHGCLVYITAKSTTAGDQHLFKINISTDVAHVTTWDGSSWTTTGTISGDFSAGAAFRFGFIPGATEGRLSVWVAPTAEGDVALTLTPTGAVVPAYTPAGSPADVTRFGCHLEAGESGAWHSFEQNSAPPESWFIPWTDGDTFLGRPVAYGPGGTYLTDDIVLVADEGRSTTGDSWTVASAYDRSLERALDANPRVGFRSATDVTATTFDYLALDLGRQGGPTTLTPGYPAYPSALAAIILKGCNIWDPKVGYYQGSSWVDAFQLSNSEAVNIEQVSATSYNLTPATAWTTTPRDGDFDGGTLMPSMLTAVGGANVIRSRVWRVGSTIGVHVDLDRTLPAATGAGAHKLIRPDLIALVPLVEVSAEALRVRAAAANYYPPDLRWRVDRIMVGEVYVHPEVSSWGRVVRVTPNTSLAEARDGSRRARVQGPVRTAVEVGWADAVDTSVTSGTPPQWDDGVFATTDLSLPGQTPWQVADAIRRASGAGKAVAWADGFEIPAGRTPDVLTARNLVLGRLLGGVRLDTVQGDLDVDEVIRIANLTISEDV